MGPLELEMTYTSYEDSCGDPAIDDKGQLRKCRRGRGHSQKGDPTHASNFPLFTWKD